MPKYIKTLSKTQPAMNMEARGGVWWEGGLFSETNVLKDMRASNSALYPVLRAKIF